MTRPLARRHYMIVPRGCAALVVAALACAAALGACGGSNSKKKTSGQGTTSSHATTSTASHANRALLTVDTVAAELNGPQQMRLTIYDLRRDGPYVVLDFGITCLENPSTGCDTAYTFAPGSKGANASQVITGERVNGNTPAGVWLVDPDGQKLYLPVRDSQDRPFTSRLQVINDSLTHLAWVRYPAPPASVSAMDVVFPDGGPQIPNVPISTGAGPVASADVLAAVPAPFEQPPDSTDTAGLTLPVEDLVSTVGNSAGSDAESATKSTLTLRSDVLFRFAKSSLTSTAHTILRSVAAQIKTRAAGTVQVTGYTDSIGTDAVNIPLSFARARAVVSALKALTPGVGYSSDGKGSADPVAPNTNADGSDNPAGRALNRRVTIVFAVKAPAKPTPPPAAAIGAQSTPAQGNTVTFSAGDPHVATDTYQVSVGSLFREGNLLVLRMTISCERTTGSGGTCDANYNFAGTNTVPPLPPLSPGSQQFDLSAYWTLSGFYLRDPATGTEYIPLHTADETPLVASITEDPHLANTYDAWAYYPSPPPAVSRLTVVMPGGKMRSAAVAISATAPPTP